MPGHHCGIHFRQVDKECVVVNLYSSIICCYILVDTCPLNAEFPSKTTAAEDPVDIGFVSLYGMSGVVSFPQFTLTLKISFSVTIFSA